MHELMMDMQRMQYSRGHGRAPMPVSYVNPEGPSREHFEHLYDAISSFLQIFFRQMSVVDTDKQTMHTAV